MENPGKNLNFWLFGFGFAFAFFHVIPAFLNRPFREPLYWGDMLDFLTPFAVVPLAYLLFRRMVKLSKNQNPGLGLRKFFSKALLAAGFLFYVDGHGVHLSSNAIARFIENAGLKDSGVFKAAYLFDEVISHYMWDGGVFFISLGLILCAAGLPASSFNKKYAFLLFLGASFYGFTFTVNGIEGQTVPFTFPAAVLGFFLSLGLLLKARRNSSINPVHLFFLFGYFIAAALFAYWGISHPGFPEFSALGWI